MSTIREEILVLAAERLDREIGTRPLPSLPEIIRAVHAHAAEALMGEPQDRVAFGVFLGQIDALRKSLTTEIKPAESAEGDKNGNG